MGAEHKAALVPLIMSTVALLTSPALSIANQQHTADYDQCIFAASKGVAGGLATHEMLHSCLEKFPGERSHNEDLPTEVLNRLDTDGGFGYGIFSGSIYNGNSDYTVTQVTLLLTPLPVESPFASVTREYNINVILQPLTKGALSVPIISDDTLEFSWKLIKARGYKTR